MGRAQVEFGLFLGTCGGCSGNFLYTIKPKEDAHAKEGQGRTYLVGDCPYCGGRFRQLVNDQP